MKRHDVVVVGGGVQAALCLNELRKKGLSAFCMAGQANGGHQTSCSQLYLHGGYFYKDEQLIGMLQRARGFWDELIDEFNFPIQRGRSLVGFASRDDANANLNIWSKHNLEFAEVKLDNSHPFHGGGIGYFLRVNEFWVLNADFACQIFHRHSSQIKYSPVTRISRQDGGYCLHSGNSADSFWGSQLIICGGAANQTLIRMALGQNAAKIQQQRHCQVLVLAGELPSESVTCPNTGHFICPAPQFGCSTMRCTFGFDYPVAFDDTPAPELDLERLGNHISAIRRDFPKLCSIAKDARWYTVPKSESAGDGNGKRPNTYSVVDLDEKVIAVWPTKMTLAPLAAQEVVRRLC